MWTGNDWDGKGTDRNGRIGGDRRNGGMEMKITQKWKTKEERKEKGRNGYTRNV